MAVDFANRVNIQGYLEIEQVETLSLNGMTIPVIRAYLYSGKVLEKHRLLITNNTALRLLEVLRSYNATGAVKMQTTRVGEDGVQQLCNMRPLVSIDGRLLTHGQESVIDVKWITLLSIVPKDVPFLDRRLSQIVACWAELDEAQRERMYAVLNRNDRNE